MTYSDASHLKIHGVIFAFFEEKIPSSKYILTLYIHMYKHNINLLLCLYNYSFMTAVMYVIFEITFAFLDYIHTHRTPP